eukprot:Sspe_Gene.60844::Locus_33606_Transcript_1_1_Confidence_1.000_Length_3709::g.60844::m.60844
MEGGGAVQTQEGCHKDEHLQDYVHVEIGCITRVAHSLRGQQKEERVRKQLLTLTENWDPSDAFEIYSAIDAATLFLHNAVHKLKAFIKGGEDSFSTVTDTLHKFFSLAGDLCVDHGVEISNAAARTLSTTSKPSTSMALSDKEATTRFAAGGSFRRGPCSPFSGSMMGSASLRITSDTSRIIRRHSPENLAAQQKDSTRSLLSLIEGSEGGTPKSYDAEKKVQFDRCCLPANAPTMFNNTGIHPFGEILFPDPFDEESTLRCPINDIHRYIGIFMIFHEEVCMWNPKMMAATGITEEEAIGNHIAGFLIHEEEQKQMIDMMQQAAKLDYDDLTNPLSIIPTGKFTFACADGVNRCVVTLSLVPSLQPPAEYFMALVHERVPAEARMDLVLWTVSKLNTEVNKLGELYPSAVKGLKEGMTRLERVCENQGSRAWGKVAIPEMLGKLQADYASEASQHGVTICTLPLPDNLPEEVETDVIKLPSAVGYIVHNAIRYNTSPSGTVILRVFLDDSEEGGSAVVFEISDNGPGMSQATLETLFDKEKRMESDKRVGVPGTGKAPTGFGLVMTNIVIAELGGSVDVESTIGEGTTFRVAIPLLGETSQPLGQLVPRPQPAMDPVKSLIINPNTVNRAALCHYLWDRKYQVTIGEGFQEVMRYLQTLELVVIHVGATCEENENVLEKLKVYPDIQVIITSSLNPAELKKLDASEFHFLSIPLRPQEVNRTLDSVEDKIGKVRDRKEQIERLRMAFQGQGNRTPWERKRKIGSGSFGEVYEAINTITGGVMAVKVIHLAHSQEQNVVETLNEVKMMSQLQHPNIIHYFHSQREEREDDQQLLIFMEYAGGGSLKEKVEATGPLSVEQASLYTADVLKGLHYLHLNSIIHRDIKTANILISITPQGEEVCKMTDFGTAKELSKQRENGDTLATSLKGTPIFMAPEVMNELPYDAAADIWSVGCLVMELVTGKPPFKHISDNSWNVVRYVSTLPPEGPVNYGPYEYHTHALSFIKDTIQVQPANRPTAEDLLNHGFITELNQSFSSRQHVLSEHKRLSVCPTRQKRLTFGNINLWQTDDGSDSEFSGWGENSLSSKEGSLPDPTAAAPQCLAVPTERQRPSILKKRSSFAKALANKQIHDRRSSRRPSGTATANTATSNIQEFPPVPVLQVTGEGESPRSGYCR